MPSIPQLPPQPAAVDPRQPSAGYYERQTLDRAAAAASVQLWWTRSMAPSPSGQRWNGGSGTVIHSDGRSSFILTCKHVVEGPGTVKVLSRHLGREVMARFVATDQAADLAIVAVDDPGLPRIEVSDATVLNSGTPTFLVGRQFREVSGRIVDIHQQPSGWRNMHLSNVAISGDSGGGVFTADAKLVGVLWGSDGMSSSSAVSLSNVRQFAQSCLPGWGRPAQPQPWLPSPPASPAPPAAVPGPQLDGIAASLDALRAEIAALKNRPAMPGPPGPPGPPGGAGERGPAGPPGKDADAAALRLELETMRRQLEQQQQTVNGLSGVFRVRISPKQ